MEHCPTTNAIIAGSVSPIFDSHARIISRSVGLDGVFIRTPVPGYGFDSVFHMAAFAFDFACLSSHSFRLTCYTTPKDTRACLLSVVYLVSLGSPDVLTVYLPTSGMMGFPPD